MSPRRRQILRRIAVRSSPVFPKACGRSELRRRAPGFGPLTEAESEVLADGGLLPALAAKATVWVIRCGAVRTCSSPCAARAVDS